ncbi:hypothetical protein A1Q2_06602 [Trichosporon asahii var. asahii CBS 8904]|uniref:Uncharacterized protein n=2 Tax=Trichosporon asahii var. asahii TaxID=189963 RepID=K1VIW3_TRIAC|nr:hypothetical protein A1Q1_02514 [Trichosporon asahii var. asahii CBS 2479]EJT48493.1 hypothetical protein A1Q1_02514 [Trichosporon asahii var. asahii CBS 2479]EKC99061.1 hypothetical protein A1Q2_06602 [Trichosporon asahii var. asahii CBS 8904]
MRGSAGAEPLAFAAWEADEEGKGPPRFQRKHSNTLSAIRRPPPTALTPPDTSVSVSTPSCCPTVLNEKGSVGVMLRAGRRVDLLRAHQGGRGGAGPFRPQQQGAGAVSVSGLFPSFHQATRISMFLRDANLAFLRTPDASKQVGLVLKEAQRADAEHPAASSRSQAPELNLKLRSDASLLSVDVMEGHTQG